jgi:class 3 adenylate cyclase/tetratricopeptide (TPR) repeat protein
VNCATCGTANDEGAKFCNECGTPLQTGCPTCGAANKPGAKFCNECGAALTGTVPGAVAPPATAVAERRLVTVLFADLVGFTPFAEERDAEDVRDTLSRYFDLCSDVVGRYGGTVEKFIGDAVMAVWGTPTAHEDDAERAVRAALELVDLVPSLAEHIQARAGVLTGEAAVTLGATNQGMVAGDMVNTASRLQGAAPPGTVLVGEGTYLAASNAIAFEKAGEQTLKGKQSPVEAWHALRVVAERGGRNRSEGLEAPFVGRADELRLLKDLLHATGREKRVRLVSVMGPAGIGKSRLAWEFLKYIDGLVETVYWHDGRCPAYGDGLAFWALGEMVRSRAGLSESDDEPTTRRRIAEAVAEWLPEGEERGWVERALLVLLGVETGMPAEQLFAAWRTFFEHIAARGTVVLVFEDLHHADPGLLDFIDHLLDWSRGQPLYVLTLARPELLERRLDWGAGKRNFNSIFLEPLPAAQMRELLNGMVPGLPDAAAQSIVERAGGIPLYAVEMVRMLLAEGRLREQEGAYVPVGDLSSLAVPDTLTALISSRLDALDAGDRSLIQDAAVLGQSFQLAGLAALSGASEDDLAARLAALVRRELLTREIDPRSPEVGQYVFVQALIREVAYNTLSRKDRKTRHLAAARYFEQLDSDELASALASHYLAAHENAPAGPEADTLAAQARVALRAAAERAAVLGSQNQAVNLLEQALSITTDPAEQAPLLARAGRAASLAGEYERAEKLLRSAIELSRAGGDLRAAASATAVLGQNFMHGGESQALDLLEAAVTEYAELWPDEAAIVLKLRLARVLGALQRHEEALAAIDEVLAAAEHADLLPVVAEAMVSRGHTLGSLGRRREGLAMIRAGEQLARQLGLDQVLIYALNAGGYMLGEIDNVAALDSYREGLALAERRGDRTGVLTFVNNVGYTSFLIGAWDDALEVLEASLAEQLSTSHRIWLLSNDLIVRACRGEDVAAGLAELDGLVKTKGEGRLEAPVLDTKGFAALAAGRLDDARRVWRRAAEMTAGVAPYAFYSAGRCGLWGGRLDDVLTDLAALEETGVHGRVAEVRRTTMRAGIAALEGRTGEALALYAEALKSWSDLGMKWDEALTGIDMATALNTTSPEVTAAAASAREILERLGARPFLERLDEALAHSGVASRDVQSVSLRPPARVGH